MNNGVAFAIGLVSGGSLAGLAVYLYFNHKNKKTSSEGEIPQRKLTYSNDGIPEEYRRKNTDDEKPKMTQEEKDIIREKLSFNNKETINYASKYESKDKSNIFDAILNKRSLEDNEEENDISEEDNDDETVVTMLDGNTRPPRIVKESDVDNCPEGWDVEALYLYRDGTLTDEDDNVFDSDDISNMLGDCLDKYGFRDSDEKLIYVQNFKLHTFYEITKYADKDFEK